MGERGEKGARAVLTADDGGESKNENERKKRGELEKLRERERERKRRGRQIESARRSFHRG